MPLLVFIKRIIQVSQSLFSQIIIVFTGLFLSPVIVFSQELDLRSKAERLQAEGSMLMIEGRYQDAILFFKEEAEIEKNLLGMYSAEYANTLYNIGACYTNMGNYSGALDYFLPTYAAWEKLYDTNDSVFTIILDEIARCYSLSEEFGKAIPYYEESLGLYEKDGVDQPEYAQTLFDIGVCYLQSGEWKKALDSSLRSAGIFRKLYGENNPDYISCQNLIGNCYLKLGDYSKGLKLFQQCINGTERLFGKETQLYSQCLNSIGACYIELGEYSKGLEYCRHAFATVTDLERADSLGFLDNIGLCYFGLGDYLNALEVYQEVRTIREATLGKSHPEYARSLNNIGNCYLNSGDYTGAIKYHQEALSILEQVKERFTPEYIRCLSNMGECYYALGDIANSKTFHQRALTSQRYYYGDSHPGNLLCLKNLGLIYRRESDYNKALDCYLDALRIATDLDGTDRTEYAELLLLTGICYAFLEDYQLFIDYLKKYSDTMYSLVTNAFSEMSERHRRTFWGRFSGIFTDSLFGVAVVLPELKDLGIVAYNYSLFGKGLLLNAETETRKLILESGDEETLRMYNKVQESQVELDRLYLNPVGKKAQIDSLNNDIETRQQELMKRSKVFGDYTRNLALKWTDVQAALGKKDIAIEFETYTHKDTTFYIALTLRPDYTEPHLVELFNSKELDGLKPRDYDKTPFSNRIYQSSRMTGLIWGKLEEELRGTENVYFSPAGELHNIGIEYFLDEDGEHLLSEKRNYYRLTSTRELAKEHQNHRMSDATVYGGIDYNVTPGSKLTGEETESERLALAAARSYMLDSLSVKRGGGDVWIYLEGSGKEARAVSSTLTSMRVRNELLDGERGTEESFKALSGAKKDVIHISTHGFYYQSEKDAGHDHVDVSSFMLGDESTAPKEDKALTRSGLLFAGANNTFAGKEIPLDVEDGVLTAKDISRMDLRGTDLVVLSACQTGLGEVSGDGVFGLQRGFKKAGVQSIVMSLWEVDDIATKVMMTRFYENLAKGKSKYDAFLEAQEYLRKYEKGVYDKPEYYAAFVLLDAIK